MTLPQKKKKKLSVCFPALFLSLTPFSHPIYNGTESLLVVTHVCQSKCLSLWDQQGGQKSLLRLFPNSVKSQNFPSIIHIYMTVLK